MKLEKELESQQELAFALKLEPESEPVLKLEPESVLIAISDTELESAGYKNIGVDSPPDSRCCWIPQVARPPDLPDLRGSQKCAPNFMNVIVDI